MCDNTDKYFEAIPGKHSIDSPQKIAMLGTLYITRRVLQSSETLSLSGEDHRWFKRRIARKKMPVMKN